MKLGEQSAMSTFHPLGDSIFSSFPMPLLNSNPSCSPSLQPQSQQQMANIMMANLMAEQARILQQAQYSVSTAALGYLQNTSSPSSSVAGYSPSLQNMVVPATTVFPCLKQEDKKSLASNKNDEKPSNHSEPLKKRSRIPSIVIPLTDRDTVDPRSNSVSIPSKLAPNIDK